jgi:hypothetical protein
MEEADYVIIILQKRIIIIMQNISPRVSPPTKWKELIILLLCKIGL